MPRGQLCTLNVRHVSIRVTLGSFNGPRDYFKRQKILWGRKRKLFFYKDQNSN